MSTWVGQVPAPDSPIGGQGSSLWEAGLWFGAVVIVLGLAFMVLTRLRKLVSKQTDLGRQGAFGLDELKQMRDRGDLSDQQYEVLKQKMIDDIGGSVRSSDQVDDDGGGESLTLGR